MSLELKLLAAAAVLGFVHLFAAAMTSTAQRGAAWNLGNREGAPPLTGLAHRLDRAFANFRETFPLFAVAVIVVSLGGKAGGLSVAGCAVYLIARALYLLVYALGIKGLRSLVWLIGTAGIFMVLAALGS